MLEENLPERDWKVFRDLHDPVVNRYCERVLAEIAAAGSTTDVSAHDRYRAVHRLIHDRDDELATLFDAMSRSRARIQLLGLRRRNLLVDDEWARFSPETRASIDAALRS